MAEKETIKCPYCGNTEGYYEKEIVHRYLMFTFDGQPNGASEDITDFVGKRKYCQDCHRILLKKMFKEGQKTG